MPVVPSQNYWGASRWDARCRRWVRPARRRDCSRAVRRVMSCSHIIISCTNPLTRDVNTCFPHSFILVTFWTFKKIFERFYYKNVTTNRTRNIILMIFCIIWQCWVWFQIVWFKITRMILNRDFKSSVWFLILILNHFVLMISILILKSFCAWFMIPSKSSSKSSNLAKDAILAAVSHPTYKLKWVPPDNRSEVSQAFVEASPWWIQPVPLLRKVQTVSW